MDFNTYQKEAIKFKVFPEKYSIIYPTIGLCDESGEVAGKVKKWLRGDKDLNTEEIKKELGDVLWYINSLCDDINITLEDVAISNLEKLSNRKERGVIKGDGDNR